MARNASAAVTVQAAVDRPCEELRTALERVLGEMQSRPGSASLSVDLARDLEAPVEASLAVPVALKVTRERHGNDFSVHITPATRRHFYPSFKGILRVTSAPADSSVVRLRGTYTIPLGTIGQALDLTFLRGAAQSSLRRFLEGVIQETAKRVRT